MAQSTKIDPITLQVIRGSIETIAEEMAHVLFRMSFSSIIRESEDLGAFGERHPVHGLRIACNA